MKTKLGVASELKDQVQSGEQQIWFWTVELVWCWSKACLNRVELLDEKHLCAVCGASGFVLLVLSRLVWKDGNKITGIWFMLWRMYAS